MWINGLLVTLLSLLCIATLLPLSKGRSWWIRIWDFPRLQLAVGLALTMLAMVLLRPPGWYWWLMPGLACLAIQLWWVLPYSPLYSAEVRRTESDHRRSLRILASNVLTPNRNARALIDLVHEKRPDILITLESDHWWQQQLDTLGDLYPHRLQCPQANLYGMHLYSRLPLLDAEIAFLVESDVPSMHARVRMPNGADVHLHFLHPTPPSPTENEESTERDVELVLLARHLEDTGEAVVVAGDLNDVAWSRTTRLFRKISGLLDPRVGRGMYNSFHARNFLLRWPLDHIFHSDHFGLVRLERLPDIGSDHFPMLIELRYLGENTGQDGLEAEADDHDDADETLREKPSRTVPDTGKTR